jgi:hypothetical protein
MRVLNGPYRATVEEGVALHDIGMVSWVFEVGQVGRFGIEGYHTGVAAYTGVVTGVNIDHGRRTVLITVDRLRLEPEPKPWRARW